MASTADGVVGSLRAQHNHLGVPGVTEPGPWATAMTSHGDMEQRRLSVPPVTEPGPPPWATAMTSHGDMEQRRLSVPPVTDPGPPPAWATAMTSHGDMEQRRLSVPMTDHGPPPWAAAMNNLGIVPMGINGQPLLPDALCLQGFDPSLGLLGPAHPMMAPGIGLVAPPPLPAPPDLPVVKEIIHCKSCTLFPQNPNLPPPSTRERPPGCRTVFVGGLPENASEEVVREVFDQCGEITAIRKSKKNFCHIRYSHEYMVDKALYLSGYRMRIGSSTDKKDSGRMHVDFAQARDDLYEWECQQRLFAREERHHYARSLHVHDHDFLQQRPPSPPPITHYSEHEAGLLADRLKDEGQFSEAMAVLVSWVDRGEVTRRTANHFYSLIQAGNGHVRRLMGEKAAHEDEMELAKEHFKNALMAILMQFEQITSVFTAATRQKAWDHFSKAQRKNIDIWRKQCEELRNAHSDDIMGFRREEEMEMSDDDDSDQSPCKKIRLEENGVQQSEACLREENDSLRWQLDAYRNEVELLRKEQGGTRTLRPEETLQLHPPDGGMQLLQHNMQSMQQQLASLQEQLTSKEQELELAREEQRFLEGELLALRDKLLGPVEPVGDLTNGETAEKRLNGCVPAVYHAREQRSESAMRGPVTSEKEALLLGVISTFLHVHPFGANIEYLWSYIQRMDSKVSTGELERLMVRLPSMFRVELSGVGASLEKRWKFCGFDSLGGV